MAAITWRNIEAPNLGNPNQSLQGMQGAFADMFGSLRNELKSYQNNEAQNWEAGKTNNTEAFMAQLTSRYKTPEALAAAQASGELEQLRSSFGAQIDQARTREALDQRGGVLQQRDLAKRTYDNQVVEDTIRPQLQGALALIQKGDKEGFNNFLNAPENASLKAMKQGELFGKLREFELQTAEESRRVNVDTRAGETLAETLRAGTATRDNQLVTQRQNDEKIGIDRQQMLNAAVAQRANAANGAAQVALQREGLTRTWGEQDRQVAVAKTQAQIAAAMKDNLYKDGVVVGDRLPELGKIFTENKILEKDSDSRAQILKVFEKGVIDIQVKGSDGKPKTVSVPIPMAAAKQAILSAETRHWGWGARGMDTDARENLKTILQQHYSATTQDSDGKPVQEMRNKAVDDYQAYLGLQGLGVEAAGGAQKKTPRPAFPKPR